MRNTNTNAGECRGDMRTSTFQLQIIPTQRFQNGRAWNMLNKSKRRWHSSRRCSPKTAANFNCECEKNEYNVCYKIFGRHDQGWMSIAGIEFNYWVQKKGFMKLFWSLKNDSYIFYIYIYTHTHTHTLTGHFIRYTSTGLDPLLPSELP